MRREVEGGGRKFWKSHCKECLQLRERKKKTPREKGTLTMSRECCYNCLKIFTQQGFCLFICKSPGKDDFKSVKIRLFPFGPWRKHFSLAPFCILESAVSATFFQNCTGCTRVHGPLNTFLLPWGCGLCPFPRSVPRDFPAHGKAKVPNPRARDDRGAREPGPGVCGYCQREGRLLFLPSLLKPLSSACPSIEARL